MKPTRRVYTLKSAGRVLLGYGGGYAVFGLILGSATAPWVGVAIFAVGLILTGIEIGRHRIGRLR